MKAELKAKWIKALRSGVYKQTRETLRDEDGFCCLGVLCDLVAPNGWEGDKPWHALSDDNGLYLHKKVFKEAPPKKIQRRLAAMNDGLGDHPRFTFPQIADWIEKNIKVDPS